MSSADERLQWLREQIDAVDSELLMLFARRAQLAREVGVVKDGSGSRGDYYRPEREAAILRRVTAANPGPLTDDSVAHLFQEVVSACRALERRLKVAVLGPIGTFTESAALAHFGAAVDTVPLPGIEAVFREVEAGGADYGVVPVENSSEGTVGHTLDAFLNSPLHICGEIELAVHHCLMARCSSLADIACIYAHQQALAQCREWLALNLPGVATVAVYSNAEAGRRAADEPAAAAIAAARVAELHRLQVLAASIEDSPDNSTRFLVLSHRAAGPSGADRTSLLMAAGNRAGALHELLAPLADAGVSMSRIESRPSRGAPWEYVFFVDVEGHASDAPVAAALDAIGRRATVLRVLGSYPRALHR